MTKKASLAASIATNRFALGARPGDIASAAKDPRGWLLAQLQAPQFTPGLADLKAAFATLEQDRLARKQRSAAAAPALAATMQAPATLIQEQSLMQEQPSMQASMAMSGDESGADEMEPAPGKTAPQATVKAAVEATPLDSVNKLYLQLTEDALLCSISSAQPFSWRLLDFFSNHFSVSTTGRPMQALAPLLEREAIAPHLFGRFEELLLAVVQHPAMLIYLNNERSFGPGSRLGRKGGLNENLGREILELHSLGVEGGYTQADVRELAMAISGWSVGRVQRKEHAGFVFRANGHQPGARLLLGKRYNQQGETQGEQMLRDLARHPSTARHISFKLAQTIVSDAPPAALVDAMAARWLASNGDLRQVVSVLVESELAWQPALQKYKTPREFVISVCRACQFRRLPPRQLINALVNMGQKPFAAGSPAGYSPLASSWDGADALLTRVDWTARLASRISGHPLERASTALGEQLTPLTRQLLARAESREQAMVLLFMSPEFQRR